MPIESFPDWGMVLSRRLVFAECPFFIRPFKIRWWEFVPTSLFHVLRHSRPPSTHERRLLQTIQVDRLLGTT
jgi:hypothetical protein